MLINDPYLIYRRGLEIARKLAFMGNTVNQSIYVDVCDDKQWPHGMFCVFCGPNAAKMEPVVRLAGSDSIFIWNGKYEFDEPETFSSEVTWADLSEDDPIDPIEVIVEKTIISLFETRPPVTTQFGLWAYLFAACCEILDDLSPQIRWQFHTTFHGGWEKYYIGFKPVGFDTTVFAISEEGHFASPFGPIYDRLDAVNGFDWRTNLDDLPSALRHAIAKFELGSLRIG